MKNNSDIFLNPFPFNRFQRSIIRPTEKNSLRTDLKTGFYSFQEEDRCYAVETVILKQDDLSEAVRGLICAVNKLYASGCKPLSFMIDLVTSKNSCEERVRSLVSFLSESALKLGCKLSVGNAGSTPELSDVILVSIFAVGERQKERECLPFKERAEVVFVGYLAEEATAVLARKYKARLLKRLPETIVEAVASFGQDIVLEKAAKAAFQSGIIRAISLGSKGIAAALYELCEEMKAGIRVDMNGLPVRQETIEVCETLQQNPYELPSNGSMLVVTEASDVLHKSLKNCGIPSYTIAVMDKKEKAKELVWKDRLSCLDRP